MAKKTFIPNTDPERATCITAVKRISARPNLALTLKNVITNEFTPACAAYELAKVTNDGAAMRAAKAIDDKNDALAAFATAMKKWLHSAYDDSSEQAVLKEIKPFLGHVSPSRFFLLPPRVQLEAVPTLELNVRDTPRLLGDAARFDALLNAAVALEVTVEAWELALEDHTVTSTANVKATKEFDAAYRYLVRSVRKIDAQGAGAILPEFVRTPKPKKGPADTPAADEPAADTPAE